MNPVKTFMKNVSVPVSLVLVSPHVQRRCRLAAMLFFLLMLLLGSIPGKANALSTVSHDKLLHFSAYTMLSMLIYSGMAGEMQRRVTATIILIALLGFADESIQYFLPYRNPELADWIFNMLAAVLAVAGMALMHASLQCSRDEVPTCKHRACHNDRTK